MPITLESLPVELVTAILEELDLASLIVVSYLSRRLHSIASDRSLNPWRAPIQRNLRSGVYEDCLKHLSVRTTVPRQNWIDVLSLAQPRFLLFDATLPNMKEPDWCECFKRRFLPGWQKWKRDLSWRETFKKCVRVSSPFCPPLIPNEHRLLFRMWHRSMITCTADESWTK
jgi:F-box domain